MQKITSFCFETKKFSLGGSVLEVGRWLAAPCLVFIEAAGPAADQLLGI
jgi:hypothetical protein